MSLRHRVPKFFVHFYVKKKKKVLLCLKTVVVTVICSNNPNICITLWAVGCEWRSGWSSKKERGKKAHIAPTPPLHPRQLPKSSEFVDNWQQASAAWTFGKWNLFVCRVKKSGSVWKTVCVCGGGAFRWGIKKAKSKKFVQSLHRCPRAPVQKASVQSEQRAVCAAQTWHLSSTPWRLYWRLSFCKVVHRLISMTRKWSQSWPGWSRESYRCSPHDVCMNSGHRSCLMKIIFLSLSLSILTPMHLRNMTACVWRCRIDRLHCKVLYCFNPTT